MRTDKVVLPGSRGLLLLGPVAAIQSQASIPRDLRYKAERCRPTDQTFLSPMAQLRSS